MDIKNVYGIIYELNSILAIFATIVVIFSSFLLIATGSAYGIVYAVNNGFYDSGSLIANFGVLSLPLLFFMLVKRGLEDMNSLLKNIDNFIKKDWE